MNIQQMNAAWAQMRRASTLAAYARMAAETMKRKSENIAEEPGTEPRTETEDPKAEAGEPALEETPAAETPAAETPAAETPAAETPAAEEPAEEPAEDLPDEKYTREEAAAPDPSIEENSAE